MGLGSLGALAGGLAEGFERGQIMADRAQANRHRKLLMDQEREQMDAVAQARAAAQEVLKADAATYQQRMAEEASRALPGPTLDDAPVPKNPVAAKPYVPDDMVKLRAASAFSDKLFELGRMEEGAKAFALAEQRRAGMRGKAAQSLMAALATGGNIEPQLKAFYDLVDDGHSIGKVEVTAGSDGKPAYAVTRVDRNGNELPPTVSSPAQIEEAVTRMLANPQALAEHSLKTKLELLKSDLQMGEIRERGYQDRVTAGVKANYELGVEKEKGRIRLGEIGAKGAQDRQTDAAKAGLEATAPYTLADGATRVQPIKQPDGTVKHQPIAGGPKAGSEKRDVVFDQLHDEIVRAYGEPSQGVLGGNRIATPRTQEAASYARALMRSDPNITTEQAIQEAVREMLKRQK